MRGPFPSLLSRRAGLIALLGWIMFASPCAALVILDQEYVPPVIDTNIGLFGPDELTQAAQTITVGESGVLARIDVLVRRRSAGRLRWDVRPVLLDGTPSISELFLFLQGSIPARELPETVDFVSLDVAEFGFRVEPGDRLAIVLQAESGLHEARGGRNLYAGGDGFFRLLPTSPSWTHFFDPGTFDLGFRTYVDVPEPRIPALLLVALCAAAVRPIHRCGGPGDRAGSRTPTGRDALETTTRASGAPAWRA